MTLTYLVLPIEPIPKTTSVFTLNRWTENKQRKGNHTHAHTHARTQTGTPLLFRRSSFVRHPRGIYFYVLLPNQARRNKHMVPYQVPVYIKCREDKNIRMCPRGGVSPCRYYSRLPLSRYGKFCFRYFIYSRDKVVWHPQR